MPIIFTMVVGLLMGVISCNDKQSLNGARKDPAATAAPEQTSAAPQGTAKCLHVVGGAPTKDYPYVGLLAVDGGKGYCTGTFVGDNTMITASHCVASKREDGNIAFVKSPPANLNGKNLKALFKNGVKPIKVLIGNKAKATDASDKDLPMNGAGKDVAILIFPDDTAPATIRVLKRQATVKDRLTIVGFGRTQWIANDEKEPPMENIRKRIGTNKLLDVNKDLVEVLEENFEDEFYILGGPAQSDGETQTKNAVGGKGDSGGPLLIKDTIVGVVVVGMKTPDSIKSFFPKSDAVLFHVKLQSDFSKKLIDKAIEAGGKVEFTDDENKKPTIPDKKSEDLDSEGGSVTCS